MFFKKSSKPPISPLKQKIVVALYAGHFERAIACIKEGAPLNFSIRQGKNDALHEVSLASFAVAKLPYKQALLFLQVYQDHGGILTAQDQIAIAKSKSQCKNTSNKFEADQEVLGSIDQLISLIKPRMS